MFLRDASASGLQLLTRERMFFNDRVALEVELPDGTPPIALNGRVVWTKPNGVNMWDVGVEFDDIQLMKIQRLFKFTLA